MSEVRTVYKLTRRYGSLLVSAVTTYGGLSLSYRLQTKTFPKVGYIFTFDTLDNLCWFAINQCGGRSELIVRESVVLCGKGATIEGTKKILHNMYLSLTEVREWQEGYRTGQFRPPTGTLLCEWFLPTEVVSPDRFILGLSEVLDARS